MTRAPTPKPVSLKQLRVAADKYEAAHASLMAFHMTAEAEDRRRSVNFAANVAASLLVRYLAQSPKPTKRSKR